MPAGVYVRHHSENLLKSFSGKRIVVDPASALGASSRVSPTALISLGGVSRPMSCRWSLSEILRQ